MQLSCECAARACLTGTVQRWQLLGHAGRGAHWRAAATHGWRQPPLNAALLLLAFTADPAQHVKPVMGSEPRMQPAASGKTKANTSRLGQTTVCTNKHPRSAPVQSRQPLKRFHQHRLRQRPSTALPHARTSLARAGRAGRRPLQALLLCRLGGGLQRHCCRAARLAGAAAVEAERAVFCSIGRQSIPGWLDKLLTLPVAGLLPQRKANTHLRAV